MNLSPRVVTPKEIPLERIFRKIMHRKMTAVERICFNLKPAVKAIPRKSNSAA
jgi:hypothetical protein